MDGQASHGCDQAGLGAAFGLVIGQVITDGFNQIIPLRQIRIGFGLREGPNEVVVGEIPTFVNAAPGGRVHERGDDRRAFGAVGATGELFMAAGDVAGIEHELGAIGKRVFDGVEVKILVHTVTAIAAGAHALRTHRPGVLHPAAFIHVVRHVILEQSAAGPQEPEVVPDLPKQLAPVFFLWPEETRRAHEPIGL